MAIQEGHAAARNILRAKTGLPPEPFRYFDKGFMATIGKARAVAQLGRLRITGFPAWLFWVVVHLWFLVGFRNRLALIFRKLSREPLEGDKLLGWLQTPFPEKRLRKVKALCFP